MFFTHFKNLFILLSNSLKNCSSSQFNKLDWACQTDRGYAKWSIFLASPTWKVDLFLVVTVQFSDTSYLHKIGLVMHQSFHLIAKLWVTWSVTFRVSNSFTIQIHSMMYQFILAMPIVILPTFLNLFDFFLSLLDPQCPYAPKA